LEIKHIKIEASSVCSTCTLLVGQQFYRLVLNPNGELAALQHYECELVYTLLSVIQCPRTYCSFLKAYDLSFAHFQSQTNTTHCTTTCRSVHSTINTQTAQGCQICFLQRGQI